MKNKISVVCLLLVTSFVGLSGCTNARPDPKNSVPSLDEIADRVGQKGDRRELAPPSGTLVGDQIPNWFNQDSAQVGVEGVSSDRAYRELRLATPSRKVIVAVIDGGVDTEHEDLKSKMWVNAREIPGNRIDDDHNGYIDDIHGWNFLGSTNAGGVPTHIDATTLEVTREFKRLSVLKEQRELDAKELALFNEVETLVSNERKEAHEVLGRVAVLLQKAEPLYLVLKEVLLVQDVKAFDMLTRKSVEDLVVTDPALVDAKTQLIQAFEVAIATTIARAKLAQTRMEETLNFTHNPDFDPRKEIIGDDPNDVNDHNYGNADVKGPDAGHGTHVAGIIAAQRENGLGIDGVAIDVEIMALRAVPNGDEYDKDIANAVRYAVDNGAQVINMSFGKAYSPLKAAVDAAFEYAATRGVMLVHAAGNSALDNDVSNHFPSRLNAAQGTQIAGWLEVGASSALKGKELPAVFSNYGKTAVDLFAPGVKIRSSVPDHNAYKIFSGTSMASPAAAGVAAVIKGQFPHLTGSAIREAMMASVVTYPDLEVRKPFEMGEAVMIPFLNLSITGGVVNLYRALKHLGVQ